MSAPINDGGPAFPASPCVGPNDDLYRPADIGQAGMTLRDYFAAQALNGWLSRIAANQDAENLFEKAGIQPDMIERMVAKVCYDMADAMIAARDGKEAS